ncbi:MAG: hypothetical protein ACTSPG_08180 [Candidatus Hodarchaeales archaeon]
MSKYTLPLLFLSILPIALSCQYTTKGSSQGYYIDQTLDFWVQDTFKAYNNYDDDGDGLVDFTDGDYDEAIYKISCKVTNLTTNGVFFVDTSLDISYFLNYSLPLDNSLILIMMIVSSLLSLIFVTSLTTMRVMVLRYWVFSGQSTVFQSALVLVPILIIPKLFILILKLSDFLPTPIRTCGSMRAYLFFPRDSVVLIRKLVFISSPIFTTPSVLLSISTSPLLHMVLAHFLSSIYSKDLVLTYSGVYTRVNKLVCMLLLIL